jgi:ATP-dependent Clp protease ATP-binding subunit ClpA
MGLNQFDPSKANECAVRAFKIAADFNHEYVTLEHLLFSLLNEDSITQILDEIGTNIPELMSDLQAYFNTDLGMKSSGRRPPRRTSSLQRVADRAVSQVMFSGRRVMEPSDLLVSLMQEPDCHAEFFLRKNGADLVKLKRFLSHGEVDHDGIASETIDSPVHQQTPAESGEPTKRADKLLRKYCVLLNERASEGRIDPLIGREQDVERLVLVLARRHKNNPIIVGEPGVGKSQLIHGLALKIVNGEVPEVLKPVQVWSLDIGALMAGTKFRGDMEERIKNVLRSIELVERNSDTRIILFIDEIHMIMGAGGGSQGSMDVSNLLKPALSNGDLRCIGSTTFDEYRKHFEKDRALLRRFQKLDISEPSIADAKKILRGVAPAYAQFHGVQYDGDALDAAVELSARHITDRVLPDKAIDVIDVAGARQRLIKNTPDFKEHITVTMIETEVASLAKIPARNIKDDEATKLAALDSDLQAVVFDQNEAIEQLTNAIYMSRAGLREPNKPVGNYLFVGPSGVGKTAVCKQLAQTLGVPLVRFDMSEYMEKHTVSRLIGAPPGYVGFADGQSGSGLLTNAVETSPHCVLLLDEIEKAHQDVLNILLQVMDDGRLTSGTGKTVNFTNVVLIMTSNAGAALMEQEPIGFQRTERDGEDEKVIKDLFAPEFRNRLDAVVRFNKLAPATMIKVVDKFLDELNTLASDKNVIIRASPEAKDWLAKKGYSPKFGARPLARVIDEYVKKPLSREMLFGKLKQGGISFLTLEDDVLQLSSEALPAVSTIDFKIAQSP